MSVEEGVAIGSGVGILETNYSDGVTFVILYNHDNLFKLDQVNNRLLITNKSIDRETDPAQQYSFVVQAVTENNLVDFATVTIDSFVKLISN